jgi:EAL domain-containing protein (putative c-di-GMP-specific phosphodiesterase class I)
VEELPPVGGSRRALAGRPGERPLRPLADGATPATAPVARAAAVRHTARLQRQAGRAGAASTGVAGHPTDEAISRQIAGAVEQGSFEVRYQPVFHLGTRALVGVDASARWPGAPRVGDRRHAVVQQVADQALSELSTGLAALGRWWVRIGVGAEQLVDRSFVAQLGARADAAGVDRTRLRLGVREPDLALSLVTGRLPHLAEAGIAIDLGAFGQGSLCPSALRDLPIASLRVQVRGCRADDGADRALVSSLVGASASLGVEVIAERIDADAELVLVHDAGIRLVQGDRWGTPGPLAKVLTTWARP